jgi:hypothetical protein
MARPEEVRAKECQRGKARHAEPTIQAPDALPIASCRIPVPVQGLLEFLLGVL